MRHALTLSLLAFLAGCDSRPVPGAEVADPRSSDDGEGPPVAHPPPGMLACDAPAQLVAAAVSLDGAVSTVRKIEGTISQASSAGAPNGPGFANHGVTVRYLLGNDPEVSVHLALDRLLAVGEGVAFDAAAPSPGGLAITRGSGWNDELRSTQGDLFAGWARVARVSERDFTTSFCLLGWRDGGTAASFTWARVSLPEMTFSLPSY